MASTTRHSAWARRTADPLLLGDGGHAPPTAGQPVEDRLRSAALANAGGAAITRNGSTVTYGTLDAVSNGLAHRLRAAGAGRDDVVGICLPREPTSVAAILGVLKSGAAYLPIDPSHPLERQRFMLRDSDARVLITTESWREDLIDPGIEVLTVREQLSAAPEEQEPPERRADGRDLAYVMYTSGSTGTPKGVMVERRSVAAFVDWALRTFSREELRDVLLSTSLGFDISIFEILVPLAAGGRISLVDNLLRFSGDDSDVTLVNTVPSLMAAYLNNRTLPPSVRTVVLAGEPLPAELANKVLAQPGVERLVNAYGPTEDTIYSTYAEIRAGAAPTIGRPLPGTRAYVLDDELRPAAVGKAGELCLAGVGVSRGYRGRADLTRERFVDWNRPDGVAERVYRTGDLARWGPDGALRHLGRIDNQVKIRGVRIEPGEIEDGLLRHPDVRQAAAVARADRERGSELVAYFVAKNGQRPSAQELRKHLRAILPEAMVPATFVPVDEMPLTPNGKLDRTRLPEPTETANVEASPLTQTEARLAELWTEVLGVGHEIAPDSDFFDLGGNSLLAFLLFDRIAESFGCEMPPHVLVEANTLQALAHRIDTGGVTNSRLLALHLDGELPPCVYVHSGAGGMLTLRTFAAIFGPEQPIIGLRAFDDRAFDVGHPPATPETAAECIAAMREAQPSGPYYLAGHSVGGHIAFEMALQLQAAGEDVVFLGLLDPAAPHTLRRLGRVKARASELTGRGPEGRRAGLARAALRALRERFVERADTPPTDQEQADEAWADNLRIVEERYDPHVFDGDAIVYRTADTARYTGTNTLGWDRYVTGDISAVPVPGEHLSMLLEPNLSVVARTMLEHLRAAQGDSGGRLVASRGLDGVH